MTYDIKRQIGPESYKAHWRRTYSHFYDLYMRGTGIDIGYKGNPPVFVPVLETSIGVDTDYPGYDGRTLPFADESLDYVYSSHTLEHIPDYQSAIREWYRVVKVGGYLIICVPHQHLYEKKLELPSRYNGDHKRFYTPAALLFEIEDSLVPNSYRIRHCQDCDAEYDYSIPPETHAYGEYQIECVVQKLRAPEWRIW